MSADNGLVLNKVHESKYEVSSWQGESDHGIFYETDNLEDALALVERELSPDINTGMVSYEYGVTLKGFKKGSQWDDETT